MITKGDIVYIKCKYIPGLNVLVTKHYNNNMGEINEIVNDTTAIILSKEGYGYVFEINKLKEFKNYSESIIHMEQIKRSEEMVCVY